MKKPLFPAAALLLALTMLLCGCSGKGTEEPTIPATFPEIEYVDGTNPSDPTEPSGGGEQTPGTESTDPTAASDPVGNGNLNADGYPALTSQSGTVKTYDSGVFRVDNAAYEPYTYGEDAASNYAAQVNKVADALQGVATVYDIPIPTSYGITLPDDIREILNSYSDQGVAMEKIVAKLNGNVKAVNCYDNLMQHRDEYLYFRTDHHWTALGAYYAYESWCQVKGIDPVPLDQHETMEFDHFLGSFYWNNSNEDSALGDTADTVIAYLPLCSEASMEFTDSKGDTYAWQIVMDVSGWASSSKYNAFCAGDNPYSVLTNPDVTDGSKCVYIKESFGNALLPFLVEHYNTIYEIDYRYWDGDLVRFVKENGVKDVVFANNLSMIRSNYLIGKLSSIID